MLSFIERESSSDVRSIVLIVATLIATATYQTGLSPPGGVWQDDYHPSRNTTTTTSTNTHSHSNNKNNNSNNNNFFIGSQHPYDAGNAIMGTNTFLRVMFFNSIAFLSSLLIISLNIPFRISKQVYVPLSFLCVTYMYTLMVTSPGIVDIIVFGSLCLVFVTLLAFVFVFQSWRIPAKSKVRIQLRRSESWA